jgi:putative FmdB family regulatory protein
MPIYEYQCRKCGHQFEYLVLSTSPAATCPSCQTSELEQLISLSAVSSESIRRANLTRAQQKLNVTHKAQQAEEFKSHHDDHH